MLVLLLKLHVVVEKTVVRSQQHVRRFPCGMKAIHKHRESSDGFTASIDRLKRTLSMTILIHHIIKNIHQRAS